MAIAQREVWEYPEHVKVWVGKYMNSRNLLHWHPDCELLYVEHGYIDIFCGGTTHTLTNGELLFVGSGEVHSMQARDRTTVLIVIIFDYDILRPYVGDVCLASPKLKGSYPIPQIYRQLRDILLRQEPFFGGEAAGILISLMACIFRNEELRPAKTGGDTTERLIRLMEDVSESVEDYTFARAAAYMGMSEAYFSRCFHKLAGIPFHAYLSHMRVKRAISLIQTKNGLTMTEIAVQCGFNTIRNFNRIFKQVTGYTPTSLPENFEFDDSFIYPSDSAFDPTLHDCELIESGKPS